MTASTPPSSGAPAPVPPPRRSRLRRALRWGVRLGLVGMTLGVVCAFGSFVFLRSTAGNDFIRDRVVKLVNNNLSEGSIAIGGLQTDLLSGGTVTDVVLTAGDGHEIARIARAEIDLAGAELLTGTLHLRNIEVDGLVIDTRMDDEGWLDVMRVFGAHELPDPDEPPGGMPFDSLPLDLVVDRVAVRNSAVRYSQSGFAVDLQDLYVDATASGVSGGDRITVPDLVLRARLTEPDEGPLEVTGAVDLLWLGAELHGVDARLGDNEVVLDGHLRDLDLDLDAGLHVELLRGDLPTVGRLAGMDGLQGTWKGSLDLTGPWTGLSVKGALQSLEPLGGSLDVQAGIDLLAAETTWNVDLNAHALRADVVYPKLGDEVLVDGRVTLDGVGLSYPGGITASGRYDGTDLRAYGLDVSRIAAPIRLQDGVVHLESLEVDSAVGTVRGAVSLDLAAGDTVTEVGGTVRPAGLAAFGVPGVGGGGTWRARIVGDVLAEVLDLDVTGSAVIAPLTWEGVRVARAEASFDGHVLDQDVDVDATVVATDTRGYGMIVDRVEIPDVVATANFDLDLSATGTATVHGVRQPGNLEGEGGVAEFRVATDASFVLDAHADVSVGPIEAHALYTTGGSATIDVVGDIVTLSIHLVDGAREVADVSGVFDLRRLDARLDHLRFAPTWRQEWSDDGTTRFTIAGGGLRDLHLELSSELGTILVEGDVGLSGPLDAHVNLQGLELDVVSELVPDLLPGLAGRLDLEAWVEGTARAPLLRGMVDVRGLFLEEVIGFVNASGTLEASRAHLGVSLDIGVGADQPLARVDARVPARLDLTDPWVDADGPLDVTIDVLPGGFDRIDTLLSARGAAPMPRGRMSAHLVLGGTLRSPTVDVGAVVEAWVPDTDRLGRVELRALRDGPVVTWNAQVREGWDLRATTHGKFATRVDELIAWVVAGGPKPDLTRYATWLDAIEGEVGLQGLSVETVISVLDLPVDAAGEAFGHLSLGGSLDVPRVDGRVWLDRGRAGVVGLDKAEASLMPRPDGYALDVVVEFTPRTFGKNDEQREVGSLTVSGSLPVSVDLRKGVDAWIAGELDLTVGGGGVPIALATAVVPDLQDVQGVVVVAGNLTGSVVDPSFDVDVRLDDGVVSHPFLGNRIENIDLLANVAGRELTLVGFTAQFKALRARGVRAAPKRDTPAVKAWGGLSLAHWLPEDVDLHATLHHAVVSAHPERYVEVSTERELTLTGDWPRLHAAGAIVVDEADVYVDLATLTLAAPLALDDRLVVHRGQPPRPLEVRGEPFYKDFTADLDLDLGRGVTGRANVAWLDFLGSVAAAAFRANAEATVTGRIHAALANGVPVLTGGLEIQEGKVDVAQAELELTRGGSVRFLSEDFMSPDLQIEARMPVNDSYVAIRVAGNPWEPDLTFSSDRYQDETQIMVILATGKAPEDLDPAAMAGVMLSLALDTALGGFNFGQFSIDTDGTVHIGVPLYRSLRAETVVKPFAAADQNRVALGLDWSITRGLVLSAAAGNRRGWADLLWRFKW